MTINIELDTVADGAYGTTGEIAGERITEGYDVDFEVVTEHGPAGGNPVLRFTGIEAELRRMVLDHYGQDTLDEFESFIVA